MLKSREELKDWVKEQVIEMFDFILEDHDVEEAMIHLKNKWHYVPSAEEFYYLSYRQGDISDVIEELEKELQGDMKESRRGRRIRV